MLPHTDKSGTASSARLKPISQLRFDYDTTAIRLRRKIDMFIFCLCRIGCRIADARDTSYSLVVVE